MPTNDALRDLILEYLYNDKWARATKYMPLSEIAKAINKDLITVRAIVDELEVEGLVKLDRVHRTKDDPADCGIKLSPRGRNVWSQKPKVKWWATKGFGKVDSGADTRIVGHTPSRKLPIIVRKTRAEADAEQGVYEVPPETPESEKDYGEFKVPPPKTWIWPKWVLWVMKFWYFVAVAVVSGIILFALFG